MTLALDARNLKLRDVQDILKIEQRLSNSFASVLNLENLTEAEQQELEEISNLYQDYYAEGKISEGLIKFLFISPLMKLAGFSQPNIKFMLEENIADISIEDEDTLIKGRMDILAINRQRRRTETTPFWILVVETKNSSVDAMEGLPQLLSYLYPVLERQPVIWGLTTNGMRYQFVNIQQGDTRIYQLLPDLNLTRPDSAIELLQVLKAIRQQYFDADN